jgi:23S rRNA pseudouridine1911/1915/1917 synthase
MSAEEIVASVEAEGQRVDRFVCDRIGKLGRAAARRLIEAGVVRVNGHRVAAGQRLRQGDRVALADVPTSSAALPDPSAVLRVVFEDAWLLAIDKPAGMAAHPLRPGELGTVASALLARYPELAGVGYSPREPGLVHRLDQDTSGLMLAARDAQTFAALRAQLEASAIDKRYVALCGGELTAPAVHEAWLSARGRAVTVRAEPFASAQPVQTELLDARTHGAFCLVSVRVWRARRHQIRAHLAALGHPLAGDTLYGGAAIEGLDRHFLHANELRLSHPHTGEPLALQAPLPEPLQTVLARLRT